MGSMGGRVRRREDERKKRRIGGRMLMSALYYSGSGLSRCQTRKDACFDDDACAIRFNAARQGKKRVFKTQLIAQWLKKRKRS